MLQLSSSIAVLIVSTHAWGIINLATIVSQLVTSSIIHSGGTSINASTQLPVAGTILSEHSCLIFLLQLIASYMVHMLLHNTIQCKPYGGDNPVEDAKHQVQLYLCMILILTNGVSCQHAGHYYAWYSSHHRWKVSHYIGGHLSDFKKIANKVLTFNEDSQT